MKDYRDLNIENYVKSIAEDNKHDNKCLYYKLQNNNLFLVHVVNDPQPWDVDGFILPINFKSEYTYCSKDIAMCITIQQEALFFLGHKKWPKNFPYLCDMHVIDSNQL